MKERVLDLSLDEAVELLSSRKWNLYSVLDETVRLEAPVSTEESYVVEIAYRNRQELANIEKLLKKEGFVKQKVHYVSD